jgi:hypothetical protein
MSRSRSAELGTGPGDVHDRGHILRAGFGATMLTSFVPLIPKRIAQEMP